MGNLKEFLTQSAEPTADADSKRVSSPFPALQRQALMNTMSKSIGLAAVGHFQGDKAAEFADQVSELATSDAVMDQLSDQLGMPRENETEDEFVARAKATMAQILSDRLSEH